ncbi:cation-translocating P-type ATPase [Panacibacter ginsenosidivorans]|uniref:Cation-translocating P-type ATPase n=1 Tax=Panacibacter ginsenosidivorans TaxID=1813871 RepID=A0A5B8V3N9_9BACT|nr:cation-translocating P-type ATPase [Panacibacter ginsenosidivorans]QEC65789.1 cation-translocating P-type ATPase [Panacibacter ginsenosidivorans]
MPGKVIELGNVIGLSGSEVPSLQLQYGKNIFHAEPSRGFIHIVWDVVKEPMFILLFVACLLYFILGEVSEGIMMLVAIILVTAISLYQEVKSSNALKALQEFTEPKVTVIRDGKEIVIAAEELVPGDIMLLDEGMNIPADAIILQANDLTVNESIITGESLPVDKNETENSNALFQGTTINSGKCIAQVTATGNNTTLGKLGKTIGTYQPPKTLLQQQINKFVRRFALFGFLGFCIIFFVNYLHHREFVTSLLFALTLAMSVIPEEIPVAFSSFMALGTYKMSKLGIISRQPQIVENLGAVSVLCFDKTGTLTENKMQVKTVYDYKSDALLELDHDNQLQDDEVLYYAMLASEVNPFDAMEKAILEAYHLYTNAGIYHPLKMIYEYPLEGQPPMMTHVYEHDNTKVVTAKGAAERIINICHLNENDKKKISAYVKLLATKGYRVIGVAGAAHTEQLFPSLQDDFNWQFKGLLALYDAPKKNIAAVLQQFYNAKIEVKLITGDYPETAMNIAGQVGLVNHLNSVTGDEVMNMTQDSLMQLVKNTNVFARMFPDAKMKVIDAIKANGEIVAMTGDGVNDGPALKSANIGIAMGQRGTEIARQAADLILTDDNIESMVTAIREGRKIFSNLKKAIRYIISIHIPIILTASLPLIFGWVYPNIFSPVHIIFMELIMGPTCSIFFEREPVEKNIMQQTPRERKDSLFTKKELLVSFVQGIIIAAGALGLYHYFMNNGATLEQTRTIVFTSLIVSNIFLTFANRSFSRTIYYTSRYKNNLVPVILIVSVLFLLSLHFIPFVRNLFQLAAITQVQFWLCSGVAFVCVMWFEVYKSFFKNTVTTS